MLWFSRKEVKHGHTLPSGRPSSTRCRVKEEGHGVGDPIDPKCPEQVNPETQSRLVVAGAGEVGDESVLE